MVSKTTVGSSILSSPAIFCLLLHNGVFLIPLFTGFLKYLKIKKINNDFDICILTKINSEEEKVIKKKYLIKNKIHNIIFVPYEKEKSQFVNPKLSILIDDEVNNLNDWNKNGGKSIFFNKELKNIDSYRNLNNNYKTINDLFEIYDLIKSE